MPVPSLLYTRKRLSVPGRWSQGRLKATTFPLSRSPLRMSANHRWRVDDLDDGIAIYKLLVFFRADREEYGAWLARTSPTGELFVVVRLEDHASHPGLHVHAECLRDVLPPAGRQVYPGLVRTPREGGRRRGGFTETEALSVAYTFFRVDVPGEGGLL